MTTAADQRWTPLTTAMRRGALSLSALAVVGLSLSGCGGGSQVKKFEPANIVSFGDESSALASMAVGSGTLTGLKYTVNSTVIYKSYDENLVFVNPIPSATGTLSTTQAAWVNFPDVSTYVGSSTLLRNTDQVERSYTLDVAYTDLSSAPATTQVAIRYQYGVSCINNRLWIQLLANSYGKGYRSQCALDAEGAVSYAEAGATVDQVANQVSSHLGEINGSTLVTMLAGQNDIVAAYDSADSDAVAQAKLKAKGQQLGQVLNTIIAKGARVLIMTVPDLGLSPKASANRARMTALVNSFNEGVIGTGGVKNDGHFVGRVKGFEHIQDMVNAPSSYGLINVTTPACSSSRDPVTGAELLSTDPHFLLGCSNFTLQNGATYYPNYNYLWADDTHLTPAAHAGLGNLAYVRARDNPF